MGCQLFLCGVVEGAFGAPLRGCEVPDGAPAVVDVGFVSSGVGGFDDVADEGVVVEPFSVVGGDVGAAVADVAFALGVDGPGGGVDEFAAVGHPHGVFGVDFVGVVFGAAHGVVALLGVNDFGAGAAAVGVGVFAEGDGDGFEVLAVLDDVHVVGVGVDFHDEASADGEVLGGVGAESGGGDEGAGEGEVDVDACAGLPVGVGAPDEGVVAEPAPAAGLGGCGGDGGALFDVLFVGDGAVEVDADGEADAVGLGAVDGVAGACLWGLSGGELDGCEGLGAIGDGSGVGGVWGADADDGAGGGVPGEVGVWWGEAHVGGFVAVGAKVGDADVDEAGVDVGGGSGDDGRGWGRCDRRCGLGFSRDVWGGFCGAGRGRDEGRRRGATCAIHRDGG